MIRDEDRFRKEIFEEKVYGEPASGVIIDIGAHIGLFTEYSHNTASMIYAIEPALNNYQELLERTKDWSNVKCFNFAVSCKGAANRIYEGGSDGAWSLGGQGGWSGNHQEVVIITLEEFMTNNGIEHVDLLKIDCEGCENSVIFAPEFRNIADKIDVIVGELHGGNGANRLEEYGYVIDPKSTSQIFRARRIK